MVITLHPKRHPFSSDLSSIPLPLALLPPPRSSFPSNRDPSRHATHLRLPAATRPFAFLKATILSDLSLIPDS